MAEKLPPAQSKTKAVIDLDKDLFDSSKISKNLSQEIIVISVDKAKLCLLENQKVLKSYGGWIAPAGILATLITTLSAAKFTEFFGITADTWKAFFMLSTIGCSVWLLITIIQALRNIGKGSVEYVVSKLKESEPQ